MRRVLIGIALVAVIAAACGGGSSAGGDDTSTTTAATMTGDAVSGFTLYQATCMACHGPNGEGIEGLGKPWVGSTFINERTDLEMYEFLLVGRPADDPLNTTGVAMLPKGGNPSLTDQDLYDLIAFMRSLNI